MATAECRCGATHAESAKFWPPCTPCPKCNTIPSDNAATSAPPLPHSWVTTEIVCDHGLVDLTVCAWCGKARVLMSGQPVRRALLAHATPLT